jgi:hypothetical protein
MANDIDFVQLWVDGNDKDWQTEKGKYIPDYNSDAPAMRYRDWDNLQYWFRGVEKYAPWVRKIHLVTPGHFPKWLNKNHEKLNCINQNEFLKKEFIPVFNSNAIEINLHRIESLADKFVLFCDDMFIVNKIKETNFFRNDLPCDQAIMNCIPPTDPFNYIDFNNMFIINKYFKKKDVLKNNLLKWYNPIYGMLGIKNILMLPWKNFAGMHNPHLPMPYLKRTFQEVWDIESQLLNKMSQNKFRSKEDVSHWLFRYWRIMKGNFYPSKIFGKTKYLSDNAKNNASIYDIIRKQKFRMICVNDSENIDFDMEKQRLKNALEYILPEKSNYEI